MNIVFDLGGVVFDWRPEHIITAVFSEKADQDIVRKEIFQHSDWLELDRGTLDQEEAIMRSTKRTGLDEAVIRQLFVDILKALAPIEESIKLLDSIKDSNNKFYVLSNMHTEFMKHLVKEYSFFDMFEGKVFSCDVHMIKPEPQIYEYLLATFDLVAAETVFIDDMKENTTAAEVFGIKTIHFTSTAQCRKELENMGCI